MQISLRSYLKEKGRWGRREQKKTPGFHLRVTNSHAYIQTYMKKKRKTHKGKKEMEERRGGREGPGKIIYREPLYDLGHL